MAWRALQSARGRGRGSSIAKNKIEPSFGITFESPAQMFEVLTAERVRMVEMARTQAFLVTSLAAAWRRDPNSVRRDVAKLEQYGVVRTREAINPGMGG